MRVAFFLALTILGALGAVIAAYGASPAVLAARSRSHSWGWPARRRDGVGLHASDELREPREPRGPSGP